MFLKIKDQYINSDFILSLKSILNTETHVYDILMTIVDGRTYVLLSIESESEAKLLLQTCVDYMQKEKIAFDKWLTTDINKYLTNLK